jgi:hypothetical protein
VTLSSLFFSKFTPNSHCRYLCARLDSRTSSNSIGFSHIQTLTSTEQAKMNIKAASSNLYCPIKSYQTRIMLLQGDNGSSDSPLVCNLFTADILHTNFEGLGVRSIPDKGDQLIEYDALSYTWGSDGILKSSTVMASNFPSQ